VGLGWAAVAVVAGALGAAAGNRVAVGGGTEAPERSTEITFE